MTQKEIYEYLKGNPLNVEVHIGDLEDLNGKDYIFLNYLNEKIIGSDNKGDYLSFIHMTVCCKDFDNTRLLVRYIKDKFNCAIDYERTNYGYYLARCVTSGFIYEH